MPIAKMEVKLPDAPAQVIPQASRLVIVTVAGAEPKPTTLDVPNCTILVEAQLEQDVTIEVREVLANGRESPPCTIAFKPIQFVRAIPSDPAGFDVQIVSVQPDITPGVAQGGEGSPPQP